MWKGLYFLFYILLQHVQSASICRSNSIVPGRQVFISSFNKDIGQCECQITLTTTTKTNKNDPFNTNITQTHYPFGCNYSLFYWLRGYNNVIESTYTNSTFSLNFNGTLYVRIENKLIGSGELCSTLSVTSRSPDHYISSTCENLNETTETTTTTPSTSISTTAISANTSSPPETATESQTVDTVSNVDKTNTRSSSTTMTTTDQRTTRDADSDDQTLLPIIMGCIIGILVIIVIILTCILLKRRNHQKNSENPNHDATNMAVYSSLDDNLKDSSPYGHIDRQHQCDSEQTKPVPGTSNEYINTTKQPLEGPNEDTIEPNNNPNISNIDRDYET